MNFVRVFAALLLVAGSDQTVRTQATIVVNTTAPTINGADGFCSLQEAIYSANFDASLAVNPADPLGLIATECTAGSGDDVIQLPANATFVLTAVLDDAYNYMGPTATPVIFSNVTIEANGALLQRPNPFRDFTGIGNFRAFAVGTASVNLQEVAVSGTGHLIIRNAYIRGFTAKGGDGRTGGGGGLGAGGAIYVNGGSLTVENSTFVDNGAGGGNGGGLHSFGPGGGGGGLGGDGGFAQVDFETLSGGGGGGGGARGNGGANGEARVIDEINRWLTSNGGGGGGTLTSGEAGRGAPGVSGTGGYRCGGDGATTGNHGDDATCAGGGGAGGGMPFEAIVGAVGGDGGTGGYGGAGGGGGFTTTAVGKARARGGNGSVGGGGGAGGEGADGGDGGFGSGGGSGTDTPGDGGTFGGHASKYYGGGGAGLGGAIFSHDGVVVVRNSTFSANFAVRGETPSEVSGFPGRADFGDDAGGAIFSVGGSLEVLNSTLSENETTGDGAALVVYHPQGANGPTNFTLRNTIITNSLGLAEECYFTSGVTAEGSGNLITANRQCPGVVSDVDPQLGPLQLNAPGVTPTMAIGTLSSAFDAGDSGYCQPFDQRGLERPQLLPCDIGAFEFIELTTFMRVTPATAPFGGTANLRAIITREKTGRNPLANQIIHFSLNGMGVGSAVTDASGTATLNNVSLVGIPPGQYGSGVLASFPGNPPFRAVDADASLTVVDDTPPVVSVPLSFVINATTPAGATGDFNAAATDNADLQPVLTCNPPAGSTFALGQTTITCSAADASGNISTPLTFSITVNSAPVQIVQLVEKTLAFVGNATLKTTLRAQLQSIASALVQKKKLFVCGGLTLYIGAINAAPASSGLTLAEKAELVADAKRIKSVVGCS